MFSIFGSLIEKLFSKEEVSQGAIVKGNNNTTIIITDSDSKINKIMKYVAKLSPREIIQPTKEKTIQDLKNYIIKSDKMPITELINKASVIANLKGDKQKLEWLKYELYGYPEGYKNSPEYRKIIVRLDVGISFHGRDEFMDLRKDPFQIPFGGGLASLGAVEGDTNTLQMSFVAPIIPAFMEILKKLKLPISGNFNPERVNYIVDRTEIDSLISKLRHEILIYISSA